MSKTPVVFITFKRPAETRKVLNIILKQKPYKIIIFQDGHNDTFSEIDRDKHNKTKKIIQRVKYKNVEKVFFKKNIGLRKIAHVILSSVFLKYDKAIILEDDTVPSRSFFKYCNFLLKKYENNKKIFQISGCNLMSGINKKINKNSSHSYYFSKYPQIHGWATWRDRWMPNYDYQIKSWPFKKDKFLSLKQLSGLERNYFKNVLPKVYKGSGPGWDQQWLYINLLKNKLTIVPRNNLITNIGYKSDPTGKGAKKFRNLKKSDLTFPLRHPSEIEANNEYDQFLIENFYNRKNFFIRLKNRLKKILK
jgi:hypothetical protein